MDPAERVVDIASADESNLLVTSEGSVIGFGQNHNLTTGLAPNWGMPPARNETVYVRMTQEEAKNDPIAQLSPIIEPGVSLDYMPDKRTNVVTPKRVPFLKRTRVSLYCWLPTHLARWVQNTSLVHPISASCNPTKVSMALDKADLEGWERVFPIKRPAPSNCGCSSIGFQR